MDRFMGMFDVLAYKSVNGNAQCFRSMFSADNSEV